MYPVSTARLFYVFLLDSLASYAEEEYFDVKLLFKGQL